MAVEVPQFFLGAIEMSTQVLNASDVETLQCSCGCIVDHIRSLGIYKIASGLHTEEKITGVSDNLDYQLRHLQYFEPILAK
jgi:hypothetical protein